jgi:hypothetical protein
MIGRSLTFLISIPSESVYRKYHKAFSNDAHNGAGHVLTQTDENREMELFKTRSDTKSTAVGVVLVSLYGVLALLPMSGFIGAAGLSSILSFAICVAPLMGIILGPWRGFGFGLIAGIVATIISLPIGGGVYLIIPTTIFGPAIAALFTGLSLRKKTNIHGISLPGPLLAAGYFIIIIILYEIAKFNAWWFMTPYMLAMIVTIALQTKNFEFNPKRSYFQLVPLSFIGAMLDHSMMAMGSVYLLDLPADVFGFVIFPVMIVERVIATLLGALLAYIIIQLFGDEILLRVTSEN